MAGWISIYKHVDPFSTAFSDLPRMALHIAEAQWLMSLRNDKGRASLAAAKYEDEGVSTVIVMWT